jgi:hypothetical protein
MSVSTTAARRALAFASLDEVMPEVDRLLEGHTTVGNWSLGQICSHLARAITGSLEGFPIQAPWLLRKTLGPFYLRKILREGRMAEGIKLPEEVLPKPGLDAHAEAEALRAALLRFADHTGPPALHPFFGRMRRDQWDHLHRIHCAHHLSFALPEGPTQP